MGPQLLNLHSPGWTATAVSFTFPPLPLIEGPKKVHSKSDELFQIVLRGSATKDLNMAEVECVHSYPLPLGWRSTLGE
jgi:hypothetical protein